EHCRHFFRSFSDHLQCNLHIELICGEDKHHMIEAVFKGTAKALEQAVKVTGKGIPTTKGAL
ncbi:MAG: bifunctional histidinol-phosphatase/imidazoleglycerol-phosphate dehydratase, partial [Candidatus Aureabacteria bacterium]|nr:bifunctional histidinol-phosphatase/imidazoleglycerol-phosphate dehydratase [Candidatus Auribacterota bacterium]